MLRGMWDLPRAGIEPISPALAGRFLTTGPPGSPLPLLLTVVSQMPRAPKEGGLGWKSLRPPQSSEKVSARASHVLQEWTAPGLLSCLVILRTTQENLGLGVDAVVAAEGSS